MVQSWRPGVAERLGLGYDDLASVKPELIFCAITGFGPSGPLAGVKGYDAIVAAKAGVMSYSDRPRFAAVPGASFGASQGALQGILAALYVRGCGGPGQKVEASLVQGLTGYDLYNWLTVQQPERFAPVMKAQTLYTPAQGMIAFTRDGRWLQFANFRPHLLAAFLDATGLRREYGVAQERGATVDMLTEIVLKRLHEKTLDEWMDIFLASEDIGVEPFRTPAKPSTTPRCDIMGIFWRSSTAIWARRGKSAF